MSDKIIIIIIMNNFLSGFNFVVDSDILAHTDIKLDKSFHNVVTVLRLCGRLREVRGNNLLRYIFLPSR